MPCQDISQMAVDLYNGCGYGPSMNKGVDEMKSLIERAFSDTERVAWVCLAIWIGIVIVIPTVRLVVAEW